MIDYDLKFQPADWITVLTDDKYLLSVMVFGYETEDKLLVQREINGTWRLFHVEPHRCELLYRINMRTDDLIKDEDGSYNNF